MTKNSGVTGKTVKQVSRQMRAEGRKAVRDTRSTIKQLRDLDLRPGKSVRERRRLSGGAA